MSESRRLAAIMFSDIEGYTRLMESDEALGRTLATRYRETLSELCSLHGGEVVQNYGDGSLSVFSSAVEAARCASALQVALREKPAVPLRIGIHIGDIVFDDNEIFGAGVNTASRIESMSVAGAVLVSEPVQRELKNHDEFDAVKLGRFAFKNVERPLDVYALSNDDLPVPDRRKLKGKFQRRGLIRSPAVLGSVMVLVIALVWLVTDYTRHTGPVISSLAVIPMGIRANSDGPDVVKAGLHEGLIDALGELQDVQVIAKTTSLRYNGDNRSTQEIATDLGVEGVLLVEMEQVNDSIVLDLSLIKARPSEKLMWSYNYGRQVNDVRRLFDEIKRDVAFNLHTDVTTLQTSAAGEIDPETYKAYLRGMYFINRGQFQKGMEYMFDVLEKDPADPWVHTGLAIGYTFQGHGPDPEDVLWKRGRAHALRAIKLDSTIAEAHGVMAANNYYYSWDWEEAEAGFQRALAINPNHAFTHFHYAWFLAVMGRWEEAIRHHILAKDLDPLVPLFTVDLGGLYLWAGEPELALKEVLEGLELNSEFPHGLWVLGNVYADMGRFDEAIEAHTKAAEIQPAWTGPLGGTLARAGRTEEARAILEQFKSGPISPRSAFWIAYIHLTLGEYDQVFEWLEYRPADPWISGVRVWPEYRVLHNDPRFHDFLDKLRLPPVDKGVSL